MLDLDLASGEWMNMPKQYTVTHASVGITTEPNTDLWQRTYYGFRNNNAPALLFKSNQNFTFTSKANFQYRQQFDQCGLIVYINQDHWFKSSIEYENANFSRVGCVVTNHGYSDWSTADISSLSEIWYRLSRRGPDFLIEYSLNGSSFTQMRIFHLHSLGQTTEAMDGVNPPLQAENNIRFGLYACSPGNSAFRAEFRQFTLKSCTWTAHYAL
ncbi:hypothetical protein CyaNS01_01841 [Cyanobium sp. NS01]|nr:hypothetical protein CyaNS01_01841 [Cyanobium sp. NS01]